MNGKRSFNFSLHVLLHHLAVLRDFLEVGLERADEGHDLVGLLLRDVELGEHRLEGTGDDDEVLERIFF